MSELRSQDRRKADVIEALGRQGDAWLATASRAGSPHLIAATAVWTGEEIVIATREASPTARNLAETGVARLGLGSPDDVIMVDVDVAGTIAAAGASEVATAFSEAAGWDPADEGPDWRYFRLRPLRIQAYRGYGELAGRDVMRDGRWLA
jgi:hypothetical protein